MVAAGMHWCVTVAGLKLMRWGRVFFAQGSAYYPLALQFLMLSLLLTNGCE